MRLIDADALKEHVKKYTSVFAKYDWREICEMLNDAPTVDAVEVVRCKDCKWHRTIEFYAVGNDRVPYETISECLKWHNDVPVDYFCAWGERK